ncbi:hypothetical protein AK830_g8393 [Neonectria ditissima]|uniref:Uncharacterized protein n=1 Tax=Neonectria ditissima TaxID=78410 RepID=A0A0N8H672_9HYPO|nr:hypothetical protein AK830_g8393 [Neonectria ditissima]
MPSDPNDTNACYDADNDADNNADPDFSDSDVPITNDPYEAAANEFGYYVAPMYGDLWQLLIDHPKASEEDKD